MDFLRYAVPVIAIVGVCVVYAFAKMAAILRDVDMKDLANRKR